MHTPRMWKAVLALAGGFVLMFVSIYPKDERHFWMFFFAGILAILLGLVETFMCNKGYVEYLELTHMDKELEVIREYKSADLDTRRTMGKWFPYYDLVLTEDTAVFMWQGVVPVDVFVKFMHESNSKAITPERDWQAISAQYHRYWELIQKRLVEYDFLIPDSAAGSHSVLWRGNAFERAWNTWMRNIPIVNQLQEME